MFDIVTKGSAHRIKECVLDLLEMGDSIDEEPWELIARNLRLRSTFLFCDFSQVINAAPIELKKPLTNLANKLFSYIEELDDAVRARSRILTQSRYNDVALVLQEVLSLLVP